MRIIQQFLLILLCAATLSIGGSLVTQAAVPLPSAEDMKANPIVAKAIEDAWRDSQIGSYDNRHEEGGWILQNPETGELKVARVPPGTRAGIKVPPPPSEKGWQAVGFFHTHPSPPVDEKGKEWKQGPSDTDTDPKNSLGVPEILRNREGRPTFGIERGTYPPTPASTPTLTPTPKPTLTPTLTPTPKPTLTPTPTQTPTGAGGVGYEYWKGDIPNACYILNMYGERALKLTGKPFMVLTYNKITHEIIDFEFGLSEVIQQGLSTKNRFPIVFPEPTLDAKNFNYHEKLDLKSPVIILVGWNSSLPGYTGNKSITIGVQNFSTRSDTEEWKFNYTSSLMEGYVKNLDNRLYSGRESELMAFKLMKK